MWGLAMLHRHWRLQHRSQKTEPTHPCAPRLPLARRWRSKLLRCATSFALSCSPLAPFRTSWPALLPFAPAAYPTVLPCLHLWRWLQRRGRWLAWGRQVACRATCVTCFRLNRCNGWSGCMMRGRRSSFTPHAQRQVPPMASETGCCKALALVLKSVLHGEGAPAPPVTASQQSLGVGQAPLHLSAVSAPRATHLQSPFHRHGLGSARAASSDQRHQVECWGRGPRCHLSFAGRPVSPPRVARRPLAHALVELRCSRRHRCKRPHRRTWRCWSDKSVS
mmetsp:Transcript_14889/g.47456  ORF Transcript_14889/g.47456 Transcript_14889/m.47456 type:complete len:278 (-) Transcript_14889:102-935(-)